MGPREFSKSPTASSLQDSSLDINEQGSFVLSDDDDETNMSSQMMLMGGESTVLDSGQVRGTSTYTRIQVLNRTLSISFYNLDTRAINACLLITGALFMYGPTNHAIIFCIMYISRLSVTNIKTVGGYNQASHQWVLNINNKPYIYITIYKQYA